MMLAVPPVTPRLNSVDNVVVQNHDKNSWYDIAHIWTPCMNLIETTKDWLALPGIPTGSGVWEKLPVRTLDFQGVQIRTSIQLDARFFCRRDPPPL